MSQLQKSKSIADQLKGLSILAVIGLHLLTLVSPANFFKSPNNLIFISLDQLMRFCVPVFIFLSGFGLSLKYQSQRLKLFSFYKSRLTKLLPLYLLWSAYYLFLSEYIDPWWKVLQTGPVWKIIALGWSDYHLYFVSVIFQLYLLYPLLLTIAKKHSKLLLTLSLFIQLGLYTYFSYSPNPPSDQIQNTFFLTWIFYFVFGIYLAKKKSFISPKISLILILIGLLFSVIDTHQYLNLSDNIVLAIRFSKIPQILYSFGFISFFLSLPANTLNSKILTWFGHNSYLIYLSHPVLVHLANFDLSQVPVIGALSSFAFLVVLSIMLQKKKSLKRFLFLARKP